MSEDLEVTKYENQGTISCLVCSCIHVQQKDSATKGKIVSN